MATSSAPAQWGPFLVGATLLLAGLLVGACDQMTGSAPGDAGAPPAADSAALRHSPMPTGTSLPSLGEVPLRNGTVEGRADSPRPKSDSSGAESPYGCYLASRPYTDSTRFRSVYLYFPAEMVEEAGSDTRSFLWEMSVDWNGGEADARYARCRIPAAPGARAVATEQLLRVGEEDAAWGVANGNTESASAKGCVQIVYTIATVCTGWENESCGSEIESVTICGGDGGGGSGGTTDPWPPDDLGGGGGDGSDGGSGSDGECTSINPEPGSECEPAEPDPCDSANPPDYCDEAGSCYDKNISNENDRNIIRGLEDNGELNELWKKSNPNVSDQSKREERGGWVVSTDGGYKVVEFHEVENDIIYTPLGIEGVTTGNRPSGTVATFHTQPFGPGEAITDTDVIQQYLDERDLNDQYNAESITPKYPSKPSNGDFGAANTLNMKGYLIDESTVYSYNDVRGVGTSVGRCGY